MMRSMFKITIILYFSQVYFIYICKVTKAYRTMHRKPIVALIYDFDGTLSPGNMQEFGFIQAIGKTPAEFWTLSDGIARGQDASNITAYMKMMLDESKKKGIVLKKQTLRSFGSKIKFYDGVRGWFGAVNSYGDSIGLKIEHYINSSGLKEIIEGSPIAKEFKHIYASSYIYDDKGEAEWPGIAVDYTAKTQFIFKINKGIFSARDSVRVNDHVSEDKKRIPFQNMIYFGDGDTDVPCMKIVNMFGGHAVAVYNPQDEKRKKEAEKLQRQGRANFVASAYYGRDGRMFRMVCAILDKIKADYELNLFARH